MNDNPYEPSQLDRFQQTEPNYFDSIPDPPWPVWRIIFKEWEWRRLAYNLVYIAAVILLIKVFVPTKEFDGRWFVMFLEVLGILNLTYFIGPALECYITWLKKRRLGIRNYLFIGGLFVSLLVTVQQPIIEYMIRLFR